MKFPNTTIVFNHGRYRNNFRILKQSVVINEIESLCPKKNGSFAETDRRLTKSHFFIKREYNPLRIPFHIVQDILNAL